MKCQSADCAAKGISRHRGRPVGPQVMKIRGFYMREKKAYQVVLLIACSIIVNVVGKNLAVYLKLPIWLDAVGTIYTAYLLGPVCGAVVGFSGNIVYSLLTSGSFEYCLVNTGIGIIVGLLAKKRVFDNLFGVLTSSVIVTAFSVLMSAPLNFWLYNGATGNIWGDGAIAFLGGRKVPYLFCAVAGEFYVDFLDKVIILFVLYCNIKIVRAFRRRKPSGRRKHKGVRSLILAAVLFLFCPSSVSADTALSVYVGDQEEQQESYATYIQTVYSSSNGLNCGEANDIVQTPDGILWIGTYAGLYRYGGSEFRWMDSLDSVYNVNCLYVDEEGRLWIGTNDNGVAIMIKEEIANVVDEERGLASNSVRCITESSNGLYYIGTSGSMMTMTLNGGLKIVDEFPEINYTESISADLNGNVAAVTTSGELYLLNGDGITDTIRMPEGDGQFTSCSFDKNGLLYIGTSENDYWVYEIRDQKLEEKGTVSCGDLYGINRIYFTEKGETFICADNGIGYFDTSGILTVLNSPDFASSIDNMTVDYQGNFWFTSSRKGLLRLCYSPFTDMYKQFGMQQKVVNTVAEWDGKLYVGTDNGLDVIDPQTGSAVESDLVNELTGVRIRCIRTDSKNHLWICTYGKGLLEVSPDGTIDTYSSKDGTFGDRARVMLEHSDGTIVVAGDTGISLIRDKKIIKTFRYGEDLSNAMILSLMEAPDGSLWAGTDGDGIVIIQEDAVVTHLTREDGLSSGVVLRTIRDKRGSGVFVVTSNRLCYVDENGAIRPLENFPYFNNYDIWQNDNDQMFILGSAGIYVVNGRELIADDEDMEYRVLDAKSGLGAALTANSWNYCDENGQLYLSCDSGVFSFNMSKYSVQSKSYRMMVSTIKLDETTEAVERGETFLIPSGTNKVEIFPEVINYTTDDPYVSYYLESFDRTQTMIPQSELSSIVYTNLPTGSYVFHMSVIDSRTGKVFEESRYEFVKEKQFYENEWFSAYMIAVFMLAIVWLTWFIARTQIQRTLNFQKKELEMAKNQIKVTNEAIIAIARTVDAKDENTSQHSQRVSEYSLLIGKRLGFSEEEQENLRKAALLHDIGKIGISDNVLNKPSRLTDEEYEIMKSHVVKGAEILKDFTMVDHIIDGALYHHERYDGTGYASGLKGEEIPLYGRIIGVADAFDAMTANRVYRKKMNITYVVGELEKGRGTQFDPAIVDILLDLIREEKINLESLYPKEDARVQEKEAGNE